MNYMVLLVLHAPELCDDVLEAWESTGVSGVTILASSGLGRLRAVVREDLPIIPSLHDLLGREEVQNRTLMTIVEDEALVNKVVQATQQVTGDLNLPNTGILVVLPVAQVYGLHRKDE
jgi:nitrogen regulatory protein PII